MNRRAEISRKIVQVIEQFPEVHEFLVSGDTGCHPQHLIDTIADELATRENILIGIGAGLKAELDEALQKNTVLTYALRLVALSHKERLLLDFTPYDFALLVLQFIGEDLDQIPDDEVIQRFEPELLKWLKQNRR